MRHALFHQLLFVRLMKIPLTVPSWNRVAFVVAPALVLALLMSTSTVWALDLLPNLFKKEEVNATVWKLNEQFVQLVKIESDAPANEHPLTVDPLVLEQALASLQLWVGGGVFRDEQSVPVYSTKQASLIARYVAEALNKASPDEDVTFNVRSYVDVLLAMGREREWTSGRVFYVDGKLNLIIGEYQKRLDKAKKTVEGSFGVVDDFRDVNFDVGSRSRKSTMPGRIVNTQGVEIYNESKVRPDWVRIDLTKASLAFREAQVPLAQRKEETKARAEAAKLTVERRQMREEMARMRKELRDLQGGQASAGASVASVEERLGKLMQLREKGLISETDFAARKKSILEEL